MKKNTLLIGGALAGIIAAILFLPKKVKNSIAKEKPKEEPPPLEINQDAEPLDINVGKGAELIRKRVSQLYNSLEGERIKQGTRTDVYQGLSYKPGIMQLITNIYGSANNFPSVPSELDPGFLNWLQSIEQGPNFEEITATVGIDQAKMQWQQILTYSDYTFWPPNAKILIDQNAFGKAGKADKNKSERYNAMTEDLKNFCNNLYRFTKSYSQNLKNAAILDLEEAGYKFL